MTAQTLFRLATVQSYQGKYDTAEPLFQQALKMQQGLLGDSHSETKRTVEAYAMLLSRTGRQAKADELQSNIRRVTHVQEEKSSQFPVQKK